jgi:hypothetical protein
VLLARISITVVLLTIPTVVLSQVTAQKISAQVQTEATSGSGERDAQASAWSELTAPPGYAIAKESIKRETNFNGSKNWCQEEFSDNVDVIPGVPQPTKIRLRAHAYSHEGHFGGAGHSNCYFTVSFVKIQR